jgi:hypothetical protein
MLCSANPDLNMEKLLGEGPDKAWNMITMDAQLQIWWTKGYFALECTGIDLCDDDTNAAVNLQFHWMQRCGAQEDPFRMIALGDLVELARFIRGPDSSYGDPAVVGNTSHPGDVGIVAAYHAASGQRLATGHRFKIVLPVEDARKMKMMIDFQFTGMRVAAMSGAATLPGLIENGGCKIM